ncbi:MAG: cobalt-precorrin 5A hydrolase [Vallitaleaceae bacterium]|nr:cobalt-precorrin 5A hydrolase [Vallitaleaceae bacterium]
MKIAIITLTQGGLVLAKKINSEDPSMEIYTSKKFADEESLPIEGSFSDLVAGLFATHEVLIFVMATGIVVRTIAPFLKHKSIDPAVLVLDEKGQFVISLLSGHLGKANEWAEKIAKQIQGLPVITTASDVNGLMAVDMIAEQLHCGIWDFNEAKQITAMMIEKKKIGIYSTVEVPEEIAGRFIRIEMIEMAHLDGLIYINDASPKGMIVPHAWLIPKTLTVGIGCKRGKTEAQLLEFLTEIFHQLGKPLQSIQQLVTVEIKKDEVGLLALSRSLRVPLICLDVEQIKTVEDQFEGSEFVRKTLGIKAVSEPCGYIGSNYGECLVPVQKKEGMTISIWRNKEVMAE